MFCESVDLVHTDVFLLLASFLGSSALCGTREFVYVDVTYCFFAHPLGVAALCVAGGPRWRASLAPVHLPLRPRCVTNPVGLVTADVL